MRVLHVGCGGERFAKPHDIFGPEFDEVTLDADPQHGPDYVALMTAMGEIGMFGATYCSHALEHIYPHEVPVALAEFLRVLEPGGCSIFFVPDLEGVPPTTDKLYDSPSGPICGLDLFYGHSRLIPASPFMAHHCGFVAGTLRDVMEGAGYVGVEVTRLPDFNLMAVGRKDGK